jgi:hypothetical protein
MDSPKTALCGLVSFLNSGGARHFAHSLWREEPNSGPADEALDVSQMLK